jgi:hypothetical protein
MVRRLDLEPDKEKAVMVRRHIKETQRGTYTQQDDGAEEIID